MTLNKILRALFLFIISINIYANSNLIDFDYQLNCKNPIQKENGVYYSCFDVFPKPFETKYRLKSALKRNTIYQLKFQIKQVSYSNSMADVFFSLSSDVNFQYVYNYLVKYPNCVLKDDFDDWLDVTVYLYSSGGESYLSFGRAEKKLYFDIMATDLYRYDHRDFHIEYFCRLRYAIANLSLIEVDSVSDSVQAYSRNKFYGLRKYSYYENYSELMASEIQYSDTSINRLMKNYKLQILKPKIARISGEYKPKQRKDYKSILYINDRVYTKSDLIPIQETKLMTHLDGLLAYAGSAKAFYENRGLDTTLMVTATYTEEYYMKKYFKYLCRLDDDLLEICEDRQLTYKDFEYYHNEKKSSLLLVSFKAPIAKIDCLDVDFEIEQDNSKNKMGRIFVEQDEEDISRTVVDNILEGQK